MKVSIIIPVYNAEKLIERSLLSAIKQSDVNKEIIVIDGASNDETVSIIEKHKSYIAFFISEPDTGIYNAMNKGIRLATGDIIGFLAAGDWYVNEHVLKEAAEEFKHDTDVYSGRIWRQLNGRWEMPLPDKDLDHLYYKGCLRQPASFFKKSVFERFGLYDESYRCSGDYEFWLRLYTNHAKIQIADRIITVMIDGGISSDPTKIAWKEDREIVINYGVSPFVATYRYYWKNIRYFFVLTLKKIGLYSLAKRIIKKAVSYSDEELLSYGVDIKNPWFLA